LGATPEGEPVGIEPGGLTGTGRSQPTSRRLVHNNGQLHALIDEGGILKYIPFSKKGFIQPQDREGTTSHNQPSTNISTTDHMNILKLIIKTWDNIKFP
jgi:hypothetical protein